MARPWTGSASTLRFSIRSSVLVRFGSSSGVVPLTSTSSAIPLSTTKSTRPVCCRASVTARSPPGFPSGEVAVTTHSPGGSDPST